MRIFTIMKKIANEAFLFQKKILKPWKVAKKLKKLKIKTK